MIPILLLALTAATDTVRLTYLGNMGVLLSAAGTAVVIDGLHRGELADYTPVPPALLGPLEQARAPFGTIDLLLTTHRHRDHFNATSVATRLRSDAHGIYVAAQETVDSMVRATGVPALHPRVRGIVPRVGGRRTMTLNGIALEVLDLPHNPTRSRRVANVGFLVTVGGVRVLHTGDADPDATTFAAHQLAGRVDVAVVPSWYFTRDNAAVLRAIGARTWVAAHVPLDDTASVRRMVRAIEPSAIVLAAPGEVHVVPATR